MGKILTCVFVLIAIKCAISKSNEMYVSAGILGLLVLPAWMGSWDNPESMAGAHLIILLVSLPCLNRHMAKPLITSIIFMILADMACVSYLIAYPIEAGESVGMRLFWWRSALNVIFIYQCIITIMGSSHKALQKYEREHERNGQFMARTLESSI